MGYECTGYYKVELLDMHTAYSRDFMVRDVYRLYKVNTPSQPEFEVRKNDERILWTTDGTEAVSMFYKKVKLDALASEEDELNHKWFLWK